MRLTVAFLVCSCLVASATGIGQTVSLSVKDASVKKVLKQVIKQTRVTIIYDEDLLNKAIPVSVDIKDAPLEEALALIFRSQPLSFTINGNMVAIQEKRLDVSTAEPTTVTVGRQPLNISGRIFNEKGDPIANATIAIKGMSTITSSDQNGAFTINATVGDVLVISFVGFVTKEVKVRSDEKIMVTLQLKNEKLDEISVVAYGTTTRRDATGAISTVKGKEISGIPSSNLANLLQGRVAGLDVTNISGSPGSGGIATTIRGYNSLDVEQGRRFSNPLWVVDGVPLNSFTSPVTGTNLLADINPEMIESIEILKDASAASLYGSRAANGVIIVTTKKGANNQKASFSVSLSQSWSILPQLPTVTIGNAERAYRLGAFRNYPTAYFDNTLQRYVYPTTPIELYKNPYARIDYFQNYQTSSDDGLFLQDSLNSFYNNSTNFFPLYYDVGKITNANIQTYGGSKNMNYGIGLGFYNESGVLVGSGFQRLDMNSSMNVTPVDRFHVDLRFNASYISRKRGEKVDALGASPIIETVPGDPFQLSSLFPGKGSAVWNNILDKLSKTKEDNTSVRTRANFKLSYDISQDFVASSMIAADYAIHRRNNFQPSFLSQSGFSSTTGETGVNLTLLNENLLTYTKKIRNHSVKLLGGLSYEYDREEYNGGSALNSPSDNIYYSRPGFPLIGIQTIPGPLNTTFTQTIAFQNYLSDMQEKALLSYFSRLEYNFKQKYYLTASFRRDGSSVFGVNNQWGTFPSFAAGWTFSEEKLIRKNLPWLSFGKLRASWGKSGMQFSQNYLALGILRNGALPYQGNGTLIPEYGQGLYNDKLSWEETSELNLGTDLDLFEGRLSITSDYYYRYTDKLLMPVRLPGTYNGYLAQWRNAAAVSNEGLELLVNYTVVNKPGFSWKLTVNGARNWNRFEKSYNGKDVTSEYVQTTANWIIGKPLSGIYAFKTDGFITDKSQVPLYYNAAGIGSYFGTGNFYYYKPGDYRFVDVNGDGVMSSKDAVYMGSALPELSGGFGSEIRWNNFDFKFLFSFQLGRYMVNSMPLTSLATDLTFNYKHPLLLDLSGASFYDQQGSNARYVPVQYDAGEYLYSAFIDRFVEKVDWLKLKVITGRYNVPEKILKRFRADGIQVFLSGENLFTLTNYSGLDPETVSINTGYDEGKNYPLARKITVGITFKF